MRYVLLTHAQKSYYRHKFIETLVSEEDLALIGDYQFEIIWYQSIVMIIDSLVFRTFSKAYIIDIVCAYQHSALLEYIINENVNINSHQQINDIFQFMPCRMFTFKIITRECDDTKVSSIAKHITNYHKSVVKYLCNINLYHVFGRGTAVIDKQVIKMLSNSKLFDDVHDNGLRINPLAKKTWH